MRCTLRLATAAESARYLEHGVTDYSLSHTYAFGEMLARAFAEYSYEPRILEFDDGVTALLPLVRVRRRPGLLRCYEAMPLSLGGTPVPFGGSLSPVHLLALIQALEPHSLVLHGNSVEAFAVAKDIRLPNLRIHERSSHVLDLEGGFEKVWSQRFSGKVRNQCRLAVRKGVSVRPALHPEDFETYYGLYAATAARWGHESPPHPLSLYRSLATLSGRGVSLSLAYVDDRPIAGVLLLEGRYFTLYWGAAMLKDCASYCPTNALLRAAIAKACENGKTQFDFGGSGELVSVRKYKESFGARPTSYNSLSYQTRTYRAVDGLKGGLAALRLN
jgi:hypothetical protein